MMELWLKGVHVGAVLLLAGGLVLLAVVATAWASATDTPTPDARRLLNAVLQWDRRVTVPALAAVWASGLGLAVWGGWLGQGWLTAKIVLVIVLSALHGMLSATLRRRLERAPAAPSPAWMRFGPVAIAAAFAMIAILVTVKP